MSKKYIDLNNFANLGVKKIKKKSKSKKYKPYIRQQLSSFEWEVQESDTGAKNAFLTLRERMRSPEVTKDVADFVERKAYTILTPQMQGTLDNALETFKVSNISRVPRRNIYCLILEPTTYVFFWRKSK